MKSWTKRLLMGLPGLLAGVITAALAQAGVFNSLEFLSWDWRFKIRGRRFPNPDVLIVGVTGECTSSKYFGRPPWDKEKVWAKTLDNLSRAGAKVIVFDVNFSDPDEEEKLTAFENAIRRANNVVLPIFDREKRYRRSGEAVRPRRTIQHNLKKLEDAAAADRMATSMPKVMLETVARAIAAKGGFIYMKQHDGRIALVESTGPQSPPEYPSDLPFFRKLADYHRRESAPINAPDLHAPDFLDDSAFKVVLSVRLGFHERFMGFMTFYGKEASSPWKGRARFTAQDMLLVLTMTPHCVVTLENSRLQLDLRNLWFESTRSLVNAIEAKDPYTRGHSERVARYAELISSSLGLQRAECEIVRLTAILHDVGKIGISETLLQKPGRLTDEEYEIIKRHPEQGATIIRPLADFGILLEDVKYHHERYDGKGYPAGLSGEDIPLIARIIGVADAFDAITSDRPYRTRRTPSQALEMLREAAGTQFDPKLVEIFAEILQKEGLSQDDRFGTRAE